MRQNKTYRKFNAADTARIRAAEAKRERRRLRNIDNEAAQGRYPEQAECGCGKWGEVNYDGHAYYCGGSERCIP